jgi:ABC-2 type transport system permease protein
MMNVYLFELKNLLRSLLVWSAVIVAILVLLMQGFYPAMMASRPELEAILANYSPQVLQAVGVDIDKIFSYTGFYVFSYTYIGLLVAIMAVSFTLQALAREKRAKCIDFILTKPISRGGVFSAKLLACFTAVVIFNIIYIVLVVVDFSLKAGTADAQFSLTQLLLAPFLTQLVFIALAAVYAVFVKRVRSVSGTATAFGFVVLLLSGLVEMLEIDWLNYIAPLQYFNPAYIFDSGSFAPQLVITAAVVFAAGLLLAAVRNQRQDIAVV